MTNREANEARRWLARQLAWEDNLDRLVRVWAKEQTVPEIASDEVSSAARGRPRRMRLPVQKPAA